MPRLRKDRLFKNIKLEVSDSRPCVLLIAVDFDQHPSDSEISEVLEAARQYGGVIAAEARYFTPAVRDVSDL